LAISISLLVRSFALLFFAVVILAVLPSSAQTSPAPDKHPVAPIRPVTDDYFGIKLTDPYRYFEKSDDPEYMAWLKGQDAYTRAQLARIPARDALLKRVVELDNAAPATVSSVTRTINDRYFYLKTLSGEMTPKLYMRDTLNGEEKRLVDPDRFKGADGAPHAINYYVASFDGRYAAYGESAGGSENATLRIFDMQTMKDTGEIIDRAEIGAVAWLPDNKSFVFNRLQKMGPDSPPTDKYEKSIAWLHVVGSNPDKDVAVLGINLSPRVAVDPADFPVVITDPASDFALGLIGHGVQREITLYAAPLHSLGKSDIPWKKICDVEDGVTSSALHGSEIYLLTHKDSPRFKIIRTSLISPDLTRAETVIPQREGVLTQVGVSAEALYAQELDGGINHLLRVPFDSAKIELTPLPFGGAFDVENTDSRLPGALISMRSWVKGTRILSYDPKSNTVSNTGLRPEGPFDNLPDLTSVEVKYPSYDGTLVPLSIVYKKGIALDGSHPVFLEAYGAYGITLDPTFDPTYVAWLERGGVFAVAHVRGGGEYGDDWHKWGQKITKANTWRDTIAAGEYLIQQKYTSPAKLAVFSASAGGVTVGRAITERPDLFGAALIRVGDLNSLRSETMPSGPANIAEFGSVKTRAGFEDLYRMDALHHVRDGVAYPPVLLTTGINDPRVSSWEPAKFAARMQAATSSGKPVLLRVDFDAGHGFGSTRRQREEEFADMVSFLLWQFGDPAFQPK
jgi:prolyl oligopeptidase